MTIMPVLKRRGNNDKARPGGRHNRDLYQSQRWTNYSRLYRKRHPLCAECKRNGKLTPAQCVDHIVAITKGGSVWDPGNHQSLCLQCHSKKTKSER